MILGAVYHVLEAFTASLSLISLFQAPDNLDVSAPRDFLISLPQHSLGDENLVVSSSLK